jgi:hypothetical protein
VCIIGDSSISWEVKGKPIQSHATSLSTTISQEMLRLSYRFLPASPNVRAKSRSSHRIHCHSHGLWGGFHDHACRLICTNSSGAPESVQVIKGFDANMASNVTYP